MPPLNLVEGAAGFVVAAAHTPSRHLQPAAFVIPLADSAGRNLLIGVVRQKVTSRFGVAIALGNVRDSRGEAAAEDIEAARDAVIAALLGWPPMPGYEACTYAQGRAFDVRDQVFWWLSEFNTETHIKGVS